jgi:hypothetical protein
MIAWAAMPANSARARSPLNSRSAIPRAGQTARNPKRAMASGCRGGRSGARIAAIVGSQPRTSGTTSRR